jgi:hypothetical protein
VFSLALLSTQAALAQTKKLTNLTYNDAFKKLNDMGDEGWVAIAITAKVQGKDHRFDVTFNQEPVADWRWVLNVRPRQYDDFAKLHEPKGFKRVHHFPFKGDGDFVNAVWIKPVDGREAWKYQNGAFTHTKGKLWEENNGNIFHFMEVERTDKMIVLYDKSRDISVQLYDDRSDIKWKDKKEFEPLYKGRFDAAKKAPAAEFTATQELLRAPIHEAFAQPVVFDPKPGMIAPRKPPQLIDEQIPDQKPEGDNVIWIPGYWSYDKEPDDFIWVTGLWRAVPPDRTWVPGYWHEQPKKDPYRWVPGFWSTAEGSATEYLPKPPDSLESGPPDPATVKDVNIEEVIWAPGVWVWRNNKYFWRPGSWVEAKADWLWIPAQYLWTPSGFVFIEGYWDYPVQQRGLLFTPAQFARGSYPTTYAPSVVVDLVTISNNMFVNPAHHHYYFGDYYDPKHLENGIYPTASYHNSSFGYDPFLAHDKWVNRKNEHWLDERKENYFNRRDHAELRPAHTYRALQERNGEKNHEHVRAHTITEVHKNPNVHLQKVQQGHLNEHHQLAKESNHLKSERAKFEAKTPPPQHKEGAKAAPPHKFDHPKPKPNPVAPKHNAAKPPPKKPAAPPHHESPPKHKPLPHPTEHLKPKPKKK